MPNVRNAETGRYVGGPRQGQSELFRCWRGMMSRCNNPNHHSYFRYGGRGITVCERWHTFELFVEDMQPRPEGCSMDRIDVDGNYEPSNVRWSSRSEQQRNRRDNTVIEHNGRRMLLVEWAEEIGLKPNTILTRLRRGWSAADSLSPRRCVKESKK